jgi:choline dehydrogenase-like flavoprotein
VPQRSLAHVASEAVPGWPPDLLRTLAEVSTTLSPCSPEVARRRAHLAAETLSAVADPDELRLLQLAIRSLEWRPAMLATTGRWARFAMLDQAGREAVLLAWSRHPLARLRSAFQALKRIGLFLAYADPGPDGAGNPTWEAIGYQPPTPAPASLPAPLALLGVERDATSLVRLEADVVVVGSGAGGGVVAARLASAGLDVLVLEAGPYLPETELPLGEAEAMQRLYLDQGTTATSDLGVTILAGASLGGGTTINWTTSLAPPDWLRDEWETRHGLHGLTDGATDDDIARLRRELDLLPPTVIPPKDRAILDGAAALGWEAAPTERNAGPCSDCGACGFGCRFGSKRSGPRAHLAAAYRDRARILAGARVGRVVVEGGRATGVTGVLAGTQGGRPFAARAKTVVVAGGALRTPLLLHASGIAHPHLGRHLRLHPVAVVAARMPERVEMWCGPTQAARSLEFWQPGGPDADGIGPAHGGFVIESAPPHPGLLASALPWSGADAGATVMGTAAWLVPLLGIVRDTGSGRVRWTRHRRERIDYRLSADDARTARRALVELARLARAAGAKEMLAIAQPALDHQLDGDTPGRWTAYLRRLARVDAGPNRLALFSAHQMGTARAGASASDHPCDPHGRVRADQSGKLVDGLYVADASLFPSASGVNPMLTVMTLAERTARAVLGDQA